MGLFAQILGMTMIVVGLVGFTACTGTLLYLYWKSHQAEPPADQPDQAVPLHNQQ